MDLMLMSVFARKFGVTHQHISKLAQQERLPYCKNPGGSKKMLVMPSAEYAFMAIHRPSFKNLKKWEQHKNNLGKDFVEGFQGVAQPETPDAPPAANLGPASGNIDAARTPEGGSDSDSVGGSGGQDAKNLAQLDKNTQEIMSSTAEFNTYRATEKKHVAKLREIEYLEKVGQLIPADRVKSDAQQCAAIFRMSLIGLPSKVAPLLIGIESAPEMEEVIEVKINEILKEFGTKMGELENVR